MKVDNKIDRVHKKNKPKNLSYESICRFVNEIQVSILTVKLTFYPT